MDALTSALNQLRIVALAQMSAGLVFGFALFFLIQQGSVSPQGDLGAIPVLLLAVAAVCAAIIPVVRKAIMGTSALFPAPAAPAGERSTREAAAAEALAAMPRYRSGTIVGLALGEAVLLLGFALSYLTMDLMKFAPFFVAGEALMLMQLPRLGGLACLLSPASRAALESA